IDQRTGHPAKIAFGSCIRPAFAVLERLKFLRGTRLDPFGRTAERRLERQMMLDLEIAFELLGQFLFETAVAVQ
ncbi:DUF6537 domain-containing protein, partial [Rhizobium ruizarguesonis]